jgi:hypothetical protein
MCLGKQLAKAMPRSIFREVRTRVPDIHAVGEPSCSEPPSSEGSSRSTSRLAPNTDTKIIADTNKRFRCDGRRRRGLLAERLPPLALG